MAVRGEPQASRSPDSEIVRGEVPASRSPDSETVRGEAPASRSLESVAVRGEPKAGRSLESETARSEAFASQSPGFEIVRLALALAAVGVLLGGSLAGYRWLVQASSRAAVVRTRGRAREHARWFSRWIPSAAADGDRITVVTRSYLGSRESICLVEVGTERFLIGVTASTISLLGRLDPAGRETVLETPRLPLRRDVEGADPSFAGGPWRGPARSTERREAMAPDPAVSDFSHELLRVAAPERDLAESTIRTALARSRDRLARLSHAGASRR